jgi:N-acetylmuramoyl-L-alanine amidase
MKRSRTDYIVVHCSDTYERMDIGAKVIKKWHTEENGWADIGYHVVIRRDGTRELGRAMDQVGAHVKGFNSCSVGVCLVGGKGDDGKACNNFTKSQFDALWETIQILKMHYPKAEVVGHRDLNVGKECPSFDAKRWYAEKMMEN